MWPSPAALVVPRQQLERSGNGGQLKGRRARTGAGMVDQLLRWGCGERRCASPGASALRPRCCEVEVSGDIARRPPAGPQVVHLGSQKVAMSTEYARAPRRRTERYVARDVHGPGRCRSFCIKPWSRHTPPCCCLRIGAERCAALARQPAPARWVAERRRFSRTITQSRSPLNLNPCRGRAAQHREPLQPRAPG